MLKKICLSLNQDPITSPRPDAAPKDDDSTNNSGPSDKTTPYKTEKDDLSDDDDDKIDNSTSIQVIVNGKICEIPKGAHTLNLQIIDGHCPDFSNTLNGKPTIHYEKPVTPKKKTTSKAKISGQKPLYPPFSPRLKEIIADIKKSPVLFRLDKKAI
ncbi:uncharacterized protein LOC141525413 [Cotesia typhae]|uniref:uncharacterized protein LOC141525413 n=1 Tax=Cotesia typhae TaxID=2053667 RepID=UPI003D6951DC